MKKVEDSTDYIRAVVTPLKTLAGSKILSSLSNDCTVKEIPLKSRLQCLTIQHWEFREMRLHLLKAFSSEWHFCVQNIVRHSYGHFVLWNKQIKQYLLCWQDSWKHILEGFSHSWMQCVSICIYLYAARAHGTRQCFLALFFDLQEVWQVTVYGVTVRHDWATISCLSTFKPIMYSDGIIVKCLGSINNCLLVAKVLKYPKVFCFSVF